MTEDKADAVMKELALRSPCTRVEFEVVEVMEP